MAMQKIQSTRNYAMFERSEFNRETSIKSRKNLMRSMRKYGFLPCFPIVVKKNGSKYLIKDGQHRLAIAESLGIAVYWVDVETDFDIALVNSAPEKWRLADYANTYAKLGKEAYSELLEFAGLHNIALGVAAALLSGTVSFGNIQTAFVAGDFKVKDRSWADAVAAIYGPLVGLSPSVKKSVFIKACMAVTRVEGFDAKRLISGAKKCREKLCAYSTVEAYIEMLEDVYNFGRSNLFPLRVSALMAMRDRHATSLAKAKAAAPAKTTGNKA